jgi:hypothetical protein
VRVNRSQKQHNQASAGTGVGVEEIIVVLAVGGWMDGCLIMAGLIDVMIHSFCELGFERARLWHRTDL